MTAYRHEQLADVLAEEILRGQFRAGERLPSERDLVARFSVSRGVVREAVKKLEQLRLVDVMPGGARVRQVEDSSLGVLHYLLDMDPTPDPELVEQIMEVSLSLMSLALKHAMARATESDLERARKIIADILHPATPLDKSFQLRMNLAQQFMRMSGNLVLMLIGRSLRVETFRNLQALSGSLLTEDVLSRSFPILRTLDRCLAERDSDGAVRAFMKINEHHRQVVLPMLRAAQHEHGEMRRSAL